MNALRSLGLLLLLLPPLSCFAQTGMEGGSVCIGYNLGKFRYRPANVDIVRYRYGKDTATSRVDMPDRLGGLGFAFKGRINEYGCVEIGFNTRQVKSAEFAGGLKMKIRMSMLSMGFAFGSPSARLGYSVDAGTLYVGMRTAEGWDALFGDKRKLIFGQTFYASLMLPFLEERVVLEARPFMQTSFFNSNLGDSSTGVSFRASNYGVTFLLGLGGRQ